MPRIRIEWVPVQRFGLGLLGFDHLHLVFQNDDATSPVDQDDWYVMEGVREETADHAHLGIEGASGRMTLAVANLAARDALISKIGTPEHRGSRILPYNGDEFRAWELMASYARDIESEDFPYIAYGLPGSPTPTLNSSSAIASLIYYSGLDPSQRLPFGMHMSPGMTTLLGTSGDDAMRTEHGFTSLLGGAGNDAFAGGISPDQIEKFYGGDGDDLFYWSGGFNIVHGGQPFLAYADDGTDVMDYSGAGTVTISFNRHWVPHKTPNYVAVLENGVDHLFSIERIQWNETTDHIVLGDGVDLVEDDVIHAPGSQSHRGRNPQTKSGQLVAPEDGHNLELADGVTSACGSGVSGRLIGNDGDNIITASAGSDTLYGGGGDDVLNGGAGSDGYVYLPGDGHDVIIDAADAGYDELLLAGGMAPENVSLYRITESPGDVLMAFSEGGRVLLKGLLDGATTSIERVVFDHSPAWSRDHLEALAAAAPQIDTAAVPSIDDELVFSAACTNAQSAGGIADRAHSGAPASDHSVNATALAAGDTAGAVILPAPELPTDWLF